ncbi:MAG: MFS transporter [Gemmobacter sp.]
MYAGIAALVAAYLLSHFYRVFLAVLTPVLKADLGATPEDLAQASGLWFLTFALMQLPVGWALDRIGPRLTSAAMVLVGAGGAALFAAATTPVGINVAMALIGVGCAPVLMANYYIFARMLPPAAFGTLAGVTIGIGSLGNIAASLPLSAAVEAFGWRHAVGAMAMVTLLAALAILALVRDPPRITQAAGGSVLDLLRLPALWPVFVMMAACYGPAVGLRGVWLGPWQADVNGAAAGQIGTVSLVMGLAMIAGNFAYGPLDRVFGTRKWLVFGGNALVVLCFLALYVRPGATGPALLLLVAGIGVFGAAFPMVMAHGRAFLPPHLLGRGVTLINLFGIGAAGLMQVATGRLHAAAPTDPATAPYQAVFLFYALVTAAGLAVYLWSQDRTD